MVEQVTGAADWRSETEKRKSLLRKACISLFKTWIPEHPEASIARGEVHPQFRDATQDFADTISLVSLLSFGSEDMFCHDFISTPLSMQELLVQREGTDAFLDPKNALRVVRRKFGMMTLIARMASTFEQRNIVAIRLAHGADQNELVEFGRIMSTRVEGTATEEEAEFKKRFRTANCPHFEVLYHSDLIGRRVPVPWPVKELYSLLGRTYRQKRSIQPEELVDFAHNHTSRLGAKALKQLSLYSEEMATDLDAGDLNPFAEIVKAADDRLMLTATRSIFDEFKALRTLRRQERIQSSDDPIDPPEAHAEGEQVEVDTDEEFVAEAQAEPGGVDDDDFFRLAKGLELIRKTLGKAFFHRISMVSGDVNFVDAARAGIDGLDESSAHVTDPGEALLQARDVTEPFYRARSLSAVVAPLLSVGRDDDAKKAALESLAAARACHADDSVSAYACAVPALLTAEEYKEAAGALEVALRKAHDNKSDEQRAAALMRMCSTLMESGALPPAVKRSLSRAILGEDINFWGKSVIKSPLIEVILSLLSGVDDDTLIFLQKVVVHPDDSIRRSVLRTLPLGENEHIRNMLVSHLKDDVTGVRIEVLDRIGTSGDQSLGIYLVNQFKQKSANNDAEKRALALNLARLGGVRHVPIFNAMLGKLATKDARFIKRHKPINDDSGFQIAGLEALYHLKSRDARRLIYNAATKGRGKMKPTAARVWNALKNQSYSDPTLPRSTHDPEYDVEQDLTLEQVLTAHETQYGGPDSTLTEDPGLLGRLKAKFLGEQPPTMPPTAPPAVGQHLPQHTPSAVDDPPPVDTQEDVDSPDVVVPPTVNDIAAPQLQSPSPPPEDTGPIRAGLRFEGVLSSDGEKWTGTLPMKFALFDEKNGGKAFWKEDREHVMVTAGRFEVLLGVDQRRLPGLPQKVWLNVEIDGDTLEPRTEVSRYRSVIQG